jgi:hypothetical protein
MHLTSYATFVGYDALSSQRHLAEFSETLAFDDIYSPAYT